MKDGVPLSKLVIVESPSKAKNIQSYLGAGYEVVASVGHIRDLPKKELGVDIAHGFKPKYVNIEDKADLIAKLTEAAAKSDCVYLATDPDREGEAIAWHLAEMLALDERAPIRVTFNEITKTCVCDGIKKPRTINMDLVDAQQARRILDRIVGYKLSPFLWRKVRRGLSAGRVQSVVVRLIVDREEEIRKFVPEEYWTLDALLGKKGVSKTIRAHFYGTADGKKMTLSTEAETEKLKAELENAEYKVTSVKTGIKNRQPVPPFITSTLQQDAARKFNMKGDRTMKIAQQLYEGVNVEGYGATGLITYMRTDSLRISEEARAAAGKLITERYGKEYLPTKPRYFKTKANAQDAHEAIRPTVVEITPEMAKPSLTADQYKIYKLIWERFVASLMAACVQNTMTADITAGNYLFRVTGYNVKFPGFTAVYEEGKDTNESDTGDIPPLKKDDVLKFKSLEGAQHFTQAPARYTYATLVKKMEDTGIGRPSTYAATLTTVLGREYVEWDKKNLKPTQLGEITTGLMKELFKSIVDTKFTAEMEKDLDRVGDGEETYVKALEDFYESFSKMLTDAEAKMEGKRIKVPDEETGEICEKCGGKMVVKVGRFGKFSACSNYPEFKNTKPIVVAAPGECPLCKGRILEKKSKRGYKYFQCENAPECKFITWDVPSEEKCPNCGKTLFKRRGGITVCLDEKCGFEKKTERKSRKKKTDTEATDEE